MKLTATQIVAVQLAAQDPEWELHRWRGGFWTFAGCPIKHHSWPGGEPVPTDYVGVATLQAMERKGAAEISRRDTFGPSSYRITPAGRAALTKEG